MYSNLAKIQTEANFINSIANKLFLLFSENNRLKKIGEKILTGVKNNSSIITAINY